MEIVVVGRHTEVQARFRKHVEDKLSKVTQLAPYAQRIDVEVSHEANPRQAASAERIESERTSSATTANPAPASPARAASTAALSESRLV